MTELSVVVARGDALERGRHIGRALRGHIERSLSFYHGYFERRGVASRDLQDLLAPYLVAAEKRVPALMATLKAMAEGAMVPVWELFAVNSFEELEPLLEPTEAGPLFLQRKEGHRSDGGPAGPGFDVPQTRVRSPVDRCSSFSVSRDGVTLLGHNEHWLSGDHGNVAVVIEIPSDGTCAVASPTVVCCLPAVGMNAHGGAQGIQSLVAEGDGAGVPRVLVSRHALMAGNRSDAIRRAGLGGRAGGYGHVFAFAGGDAFTVETTASRQAVIDGPGPHTNHYLDPELAATAPPPGEGSLARFRRLTEALAEHPPGSAKDAMRILKDHESTPQSVCLHPDASEGEEASAVLFSMVCDLEAGRMWVAPGNPCHTEYQEVELTGVG